MSADLLARNCVSTLRSLREERVKTLRRCKPRAPMVVEESSIPAATCEEIALYAVDTNATVEALDLAINTIEEEYQKIIRPEQAPEDDAETKTQARKPYG